MIITIDTDDLAAMLREAHENGKIYLWPNQPSTADYVAWAIRRLLAKQAALRGDVCSACDAQIHSYCIDPNCECRKRGDKPHRILTQVANLSTIAHAGVTKEPS